MPDLIDTENRVINQLVDIFNEDEFQERLSSNAKLIERIFNSLLVEKGGDALISQNSVRKIKFFSVINRVKEKDSLKEKFYRSNLLQEKFGSFQNKSNIFLQTSKEDIKNIFKKCEDIIGVKILTDLNKDCSLVLKILRNSEEFLRTEHIVLEKDDLLDQPTIMKNGLEIYKIKGTYNNSHDFELQIKSKLVSVWGDMEHFIFYKDYFVSPIKESTQATMNHIGRLVFQIDNFLLSIREANKDYENNAEFTNFLIWFNNFYTPQITLKLGGVGFKFDYIANALMFIKKTKFSDKNLSNKKLLFGHFKVKPVLPLYKSYVKIREASYDLKIFESIVFGWKWNALQTKQANIDNIFNTYFNFIIEYISDGLKDVLKDFDTTQIKIKVTYYLENILSFFPKADIFLSVNHYKNHVEFINFLKDELISDENYNFEACFENLDLLYFNKRMGGNCGDQLTFLNLSQEVKNSVTEFLTNFKIKLQLKKDNDYKKEIKHTDELIKLLLNNNNGGI